MNKCSHGVVLDKHCEACKKLYASLDQIPALKDEIKQLKFERDQYRRLAESWMKDYDRLKEKYEPLVAVPCSTETNKDFENFTPEMWARVGKMLATMSYGSVQLNMNDTFGWATAWGVDCDEFDLPAVTELFERWGVNGVVAWCAVKEGVVESKDEPLTPIYPNLDKAEWKEMVDHIQSNMDKYFWIVAYRNSERHK